MPGINVASSMKKRGQWVPKAQEERAPSKGSCPIASVTPRSVTPCLTCQGSQSISGTKGHHCAGTIIERVSSPLAPSAPQAPTTQIRSRFLISTPSPHAPPSSHFPATTTFPALWHTPACPPSGLGSSVPPQENSPRSSLSSHPHPCWILLHHLGAQRDRDI